MGLKIDLHVHTRYSYDASTTLKEVVKYSRKRGLDGVAITDHNTLLGALRLAQETRLIVIPGIEVVSLGGHILALNVTKLIPQELGLPETVQRIHEAGGIAVAAHPYSLHNSGNHKQTAFCDAVEVVNSAAIPFSLSTNRSKKLVARLNLPQTAGSDSHYAPEIGAAYTFIKADPDVDEIVQAIKRGATLPMGEGIPWSVRIQRVALRLKRRVG